MYESWQMIMKIRMAGKSQKVHDMEYLIESSLYTDFPMPSLDASLLSTIKYYIIPYIIL